MVNYGFIHKGAWYVKRPQIVGAGEAGIFTPN